MNNQSLYKSLYSQRINEDNDAVIALWEENMICLWHFYKKKNAFYVSYPLYWKNDIMNLIQATNMYAELTKRYLNQQQKNINHTDFETLLQDSCYFFSKETILKNNVGTLSPLTYSLVSEQELHQLLTATFPKLDIFTDLYYKIKTA